MVAKVAHADNQKPHVVRRLICIPKGRVGNQMSREAEYSKKTPQTITRIKQAAAFIDYSIQYIWCSTVQDPSIMWPTCWSINPSDLTWWGKLWVTRRWSLKATSPWEWSLATASQPGHAAKSFNPHDLIRRSPPGSVGTQVQSLHNKGLAQYLKPPHSCDKVVCVCSAGSC